MKSRNAYVGISILFLVIAAALSVVIWGDVSVAAKITFFAFGFGSGVAVGMWLAKRPDQ